MVATKKELNLIQVKEVLCAAEKTQKEWERVTITVDRGSSETVIPKDFCRSVPVIPSAGSKEGVEYEVASGEKIANEGERTLQIMTEECLPRTLNMQV